MTGEPLRAALLAGKRRPRARGGGSPTKLRGDGYEFVEVREYVAGDDPRRIDWAATARSGGLQTRVVLEDVALTLAAIVDTSASMRAGRERGLNVAAAEALALWYGAARADDRCMRVFPDRVLAPHLHGTAGARACTYGTSDAPFDFTRACAAARAALPRGCAVLLITDGFDVDAADDRPLATLAAHCDATVLLARDPWHHAMPLRGLQRFADLETGAMRTIYLNAAARARYVEAVHVREAALVERFARAGWRVGILLERDGRGSILRAFGIPAPAA